jgi:hypothetical protein
MNRGAEMLNVNHRLPMVCRNARGSLAVLQVIPNRLRVLASVQIALFLLASADSRGDADPSSPPTREVTGIVVDEQGHPAAGVKVERISYRERTGTVTATDGTFALKTEIVKNDGVTLVATTGPGDRQAFFEVHDFHKVPDEIRLTLQPAREIVAGVVAGDGRPVAGATLRAMTFGFKSVGVTTSDAKGQARLLIPKDAELQYVYSVKPDVGLDYFIFRARESQGAADNPFALAPDHDQPLEFVLNGTRTVTVRVVDDHDKPLPELPVNSWYFEKPKKGGDLNVGGTPEFSVLTDVQGRAVFHTVPADNVGRITFWARHQDYFAPERTVFDPSSGADELKATLLPLVPVKGKVTFADGRPAPDAEVTVAGSGYTFDGFRGATRSGPDGTFKIRVNPDEYCMFVARLETQASGVETRVVRLEEPIEGIELSLQKATRIYGTVTVGKDDKPVSNQYIQLYLKPDPDYYRLPEADRLPNPRGDRKAIMPVITQNTQSDAAGKYEFFAGPGKYYIIRLQSTEQAPQFEISGEAEFEVNFHDDLPSQIDFEAQVVRETTRKRGVPETKIDFGHAEFRAGPWQALGDKNGRFQAKRTPCEALLYSKSEGGLLAGIARVEPEDETGEIALSPTASARGRLIDAATDAPLAGLEVQYGIEVKHADGTFSNHFGGSAHTDAAGEFLATRLVPGWDYKLQLVNERDAEGQPRRWGNVGIVKAERAECVDLGDFPIAAPAAEPLEALVSRAFQSKMTHVARFERALADARFGQQRLLMLLAGKDAPPLRQFFAVYFNRDKNTPGRDDFVEALGNFQILTVDPALLANDPHALAWAEKLKITRPADNEARFIVFEHEGRIVMQTAGTDLSVGGQLSLKRLTTFLTDFVPPISDATKLYAAALALAQRDDKRVLLIASGPFSASCALLDRWVEATRELIARDYVVVKVNARDADSEKLLERIRGEVGSVPWLAICDPTGKMLATSDASGVNVGYPANASGARHYEGMLRKTARKLTDAELQKLMERLY